VLVLSALSATFDYSSYFISTSGLNLDTNGNNTTFGTALFGNQSLGLAKYGAGILTLNAAATYTGTTDIYGGAVGLGVATTIPSANYIRLYGGGLCSGSTTARTVANPVQLLEASAVLGDATRTGALTFTNSISLEAPSGSATLNCASPVVVSGVVSGTNSLTKSGASTLTLLGGNAYAGATTVSQGTLVVANATALGTGNSVTVQQSAALQVANSIGAKITVTGLAMNAGSRLQLGDIVYVPIQRVGGTVAVATVLDVRAGLIIELRRPPFTYGGIWTLLTFQTLLGDVSDITIDNKTPFTAGTPYREGNAIKIDLS
jgi:autotransporter-associated beta strand protein